MKVYIGDSNISGHLVVEDDGIWARGSHVCFINVSDVLDYLMTSFVLMYDLILISFQQSRI